MNSNPLTLVIFGATGDLTVRKLAPSLYRLDRKHRLPEEARIVGVARSSLTDDTFRAKMAAAVKEFAAADWDESAWQKFAGRLHYVSADAAKPGASAPLRDWLQAQAGASLGRRLFYLAVAPALDVDIVAQLSATGLNATTPEAWSRLIIEKPFGHDLASARRLNQERCTSFPRGPDLPHRPLPRQRYGAEYPGVPLRQHAVRAAVEFTTTSTTCRSPWRDGDRRRPRPTITTRPACSATCSRTTCCRS